MLKVLLFKPTKRRQRFKTIDPKTDEREKLSLPDKLKGCLV